MKRQLATIFLLAVSALSLYGTNPGQDTVFDFSDPGQAAEWTVSWTTGEVTSDLSHDGVMGDGSLKASLNFVSAAKVHVAHIMAEAVNLEGGSLSFDVYLPQNYLDRGYALQIFVKDANWTSAFKWLNSSGLAGDAWNTIQLSNIDASTFSWNPGVALNAIRMVGMEFAQSSGASDSVVLYLDNIIISSTSNQEPPVLEDVVWDFEAGNIDGWALGWGSAVQDGKAPAEYSEELWSSDNMGAMKLNLDLSDSIWTDANFQAYMGNPGVKFDLTYFQGVEYEVYVPNPASFPGLLKMETALNDSWQTVAGWRDYNLAQPKPEDNIEIVDIGGVQYAKIHRAHDFSQVLNRAGSSQLVLRFADYNSSYVGPIYVDNIVIKSPREPIVLVNAPAALETVSDSVTVQAQVISPSQIIVNDVLLKTQGGLEVSMNKTGFYDYAYDWDTTSEPEGLQTVTIQALTDSGDYSFQFELVVKNSGTTIALVSPNFDSVLSGSAEIVADVNNHKGDIIQTVTASIHDITIPLNFNGASYAAQFDTTRLKDGGYTVVISAQNGPYTTVKSADVMVDNHPAEHFVRTRGSEFFVDRRPFYYVGWNAYDLPFKRATTLIAREKAAVYTTTGERIVEIIPQGKELSFEEMIDRSMIEARKIGMTVVRTSGFNTNVSSDFSFYTPDWDFNEQQFRRFDYIMDSARRHGVRVIIILQNYWGDYGGIKAVTEKLGLRMLEFFTDPSAKQMYREYAEHFVNRINTINGLVYREDPTVFSWELMNEPRMDYYSDDSPDKSLYDPDGSILGAWLDEMSSYIKSLDQNHMISSGGEGHGYHYGDGKVWGRDNEGWGADPISVMDQEHIDFFTFHPYFNSVWYQAEVLEAKELLASYIRDCVARGKPVVVEEFGVRKTGEVLDIFGNRYQPGEEGYAETRLAWYPLILATLRREGGAGSNVWMLQTNPQERNFGISVYTPFSLVEEDRPIVEAFQQEVEIMEAIGGADFISDIYWPYQKYKNYIYEAVYDGLFDLSGRHSRFRPYRCLRTGDFLEILGKLGVGQVADRYHPNRIIRAGQAAEILYDTLELAGFGEMRETLETFDLLPRTFWGSYEPCWPLTRAATAELIIRVKDFLLLDFRKG